MVQRPALKTMARRVLLGNRIVGHWRNETGSRKVAPQGSSLLMRRHSVPCLKVATNKEQDVGDKTMKRRVSFGDGQELFESFTPYCKKYGAHPDDFFFDESGNMVLVSSSEPGMDILEVGQGDSIECILDEGVEYRTKPHMASRAKKHQEVSLGDKLVVRNRKEEWVQVKENLGWVPLLVDGEAAFKVVVEKDKLKYASPRVAVMAASVTP